LHTSRRFRADIGVPQDEGVIAWAIMRIQRHDHEAAGVRRKIAADPVGHVRQENPDAVTRIQSRPDKCWPEPINPIADGTPRVIAPLTACHVPIAIGRPVRAAPQALAKQAPQGSGVPAANDIEALGGRVLPCGCDVHLPIPDTWREAWDRTATRRIR
jgi:hypothetical protein